MIQVNINWKNEQIVSFTMSGHADFAENGRDLVCAGASSIVFGMIGALEDMEGVPPIFEEESGYLFYTVPEEFVANSNVQILLNGMVNQLRSLAYSYPDHIKINSK
ncbi:MULTISPECIES: ribosomal-processing cysteine protease Prp [Listeria]|uniref:ribosomal-processing cysteine protease Prp n=1 Tax=Listeria TaxID=1637 RepID=UPI000B596279|nr:MULTISPECIES: ribosomal-processing cysteine protease Prp [Listeria]